MPPRSIWNGTIAFGLVAVPIKVYSATESKTVHFREVHAKDGSRIEHRRICPKDGKTVGKDEIVKGYQLSARSTTVRSRLWNTQRPTPASPARSSAACSSA